MALVLVVHGRLALTRACLASLATTREPFALCVVDNGSTDGSEAFFRSGSVPLPVRYHRNRENLGLIRALNQGARLGTEAFLCFLHNDAEARDPRWLGRLREAVDGGGAALAGLYGARRIRRDGRYAGRSIVDALAGAGGGARPVTEVAAVDGVCLFLRRSTFETVSGFDESYGFFHGYDRDLSFAVRERGGRCVVVDAGLLHRGGGTRTGEGAPRPYAADLADRRAALAHFAAKWAHRLPADVRSVRERLADRLRGRAGRFTGSSPRAVGAPVAGGRRVTHPGEDPTRGSGIGDGDPRVHGLGSSPALDDGYPHGGSVTP